MAKILFIKVNPKADDQSASTTLANYFLKMYTEEHPDDTIEKLDLYKSDIPFLDAEVFQTWGTFTDEEDQTDPDGKKVTRMDKLANQFLEADKVIFAAPFWNLSYPPMLKAYIDTICIAGKTFAYTAKGPVGLVPDKPLLIIETRGGMFSEWPFAQMQNSQRYLTTVMEFIGIRNINAVIAENLDVDEAHRLAGLTKAREELAILAKIF